ncbi:MAG: O-methyltransferase, partial [Chloroflexi bacterium]|nr:O-methyltransferase [Chloroflexota bacterium]
MSDDLLTYANAQNYITSLVPPREAELMEMEAYAEKNGFPIIGPACGHYCYQLARMIKATSVFELGSGYGYSTAWFAKAVKETCAELGRSDGGGVVHHTVWEEELCEGALSHLVRLGSADLVQFHISEAVEALRKTEGPFD